MISHITPNSTIKANHLRWEPAENTFGIDSSGNSTDPYKPGNKIQFTPWTQPNSDDGSTSTGIAVTNIRQSGNNITVDIDLDFSGGDLTEDSWWDGNIDIDEDATVKNSATLTVAAGAAIDFDSGVALIIANTGDLQVDGISNNKATFDRSGTTGTWDGIEFNSGSSGTIEHATIDHAKKGVQVTSTNNVTVDHCTIQNFTEQAVYASSSSITVKNSAIKLPSGASHGIYLLGGSSNPTIQDNTIEDVVIGIERKDSPGSATISDNTFTDCRDGVKTISSSPEIYNNYFDGAENADNGVRIGTSSSPDIHDNDFFDYTAGVFLEQSQPSNLKWNNFGRTGSVTKENEDVGLDVNYLTSNNSFADNKWNNFYDGNAVNDVHNSTAYTLKARGNYWDAQSIEGSVDVSNAQGSANSNAGPGGTLGKFAASESVAGNLSAPQSVPTSFGLLQNHPNPFNPSTMIGFQLPELSTVTLTVYDILGRQVRNLVLKQQVAPGQHAFRWDGTDTSGKAVASGVYLYRLTAQADNTGEVFSQSRRLVFLQ